MWNLMLESYWLTKWFDNRWTCMCKKSCFFKDHLISFPFTGRIWNDTCDPYRMYFVSIQHSLRIWILNAGHLHIYVRGSLWPVLMGDWQFIMDYTSFLMTFVDNYAQFRRCCSMSVKFTYSDPRVPTVARVFVLLSLSPKLFIIYKRRR